MFSLKLVCVLILVSVLLSATAVQLGASQKSLKKVFVLQRHGARYSGDKNYQLLNSGITQLYTAGRQFNNYYIKQLKFLSEDVAKREVYVRTTQADRTMMTAQSFLQGLYYQNTNKIEQNTAKSNLLPPIDISDDLRQEILDNHDRLTQFVSYPIDMIEKANDFLLRANDPFTCPKMMDYINKRSSDTHSQEVVRKLQDTINFFTKQRKSPSQLSIRDIAWTQDVYDEIMVEQYLTQKLPKDITEPMMRDLKFMLDFYLGYQLFGELDAYRVSSYSILSMIRKSFKNIDLNNKDDNNFKMQVYACHDTNIVALLRVFDMFDMQCIEDRYYNGQTVEQHPCIEIPVFASQYVIELWESADGGHKVVMKYENQVEEEMPLEDFEKKLSKVFENFDNSRFSISCKTPLLTASESEPEQNENNNIGVGLLTMQNTALIGEKSYEDRHIVGQ